MIAVDGLRLRGHVILEALEVHDADMVNVARFIYDGARTGPRKSDVPPSAVGLRA